MKKSSSVYVLHVSDFHISEETEKDAENALSALTNALEKENISISYLIHTGDIINSSDITKEIIQQHSSDIISDEHAVLYNEELEKRVTERFNIAQRIMKSFLGKLGISKKNIVVCCGNHDKARYHKKEAEVFAPFEKFLKDIEAPEKLMAYLELEDVNVLILNTNYSNDKGTTCVSCNIVNEILAAQLSSPNAGNTWYYTYKKNKKNSATDEKNDKVNIIVAHQPLYDICEYARLPYSNETQTTDFLSALQDFIKGNGIYLCGDKHTSSIAASYIHDIPHYFCGHPFTFKETTRPKCCTQGGVTNAPQKEIEYNLIEIREGKIGEIKKLHLSHNTTEWECEIHPIDTVVADLYEKSRKHIVENSFALIASKSKTQYNSLSNLSWHNLSKRLDEIANSQNTLKDISDFYRLICNLKKWDSEDNLLKTGGKKHIFEQLDDIINTYFNSDENIQNIINIRGDYSSSKSTFLGILYMYLLYRYSHGKISYIPAYFNMENIEIGNQIQEGRNYSTAVKKIFSSFVDEIEKIAELAQVPVCYIIDGLDEQDIWSESSRDSIGRDILDILEETKNSKYIMSFCQNNLARFKNTMPTIKFYEKSYVMYFNSIAVKETKKFLKFVKCIIGSNESSNQTEIEPQICSTIKKLRRLNVNSGFIYHNYEYLKACSKDDSIDSVYMRYIENQHRICLDELKYNFIHYAPAMAYLFSYEGYTYENFKNIPPNPMNYFEQKIVEYSDKIYKAFVFIKKHKDAREYLIALHYNKALRYYAENPKEEIPEDSILNKIISRNISIIIKKQWKNDPNKFVIVCKDLLKRRNRSGQTNLGKSTLSMLIYIWTYLDKIPFGTNEKLEKLLLSADENFSSWEILDGSSKMQQFIDLNYWHSKEISKAINSKNSIELVHKMIYDKHFLLYNRQYMMWYYGDLTVYGRRNVNTFIPGNDTPNKGLDYYCCFYTLYQKIRDSLENEKKSHYPLLEYDLFTIFDLVYSRSSKIYKEEKNKNVLNSIYNLCLKTQKCINDYLDSKKGIVPGSEQNGTDDVTVKSKQDSTGEITTGNEQNGTDDITAKKEQDSIAEIITEYGNGSEEYQKWIKSRQKDDETKDVTWIIKGFFYSAKKVLGNIINTITPELDDKIGKNSVSGEEKATEQNAGNCEEGDSKPKSISIKKDLEDVFVEKYGEEVLLEIRVEGDNLEYTWYYQNPKDKEFSESVMKYVTENRYQIPLLENIDGQKVYCSIKDGRGNIVQSKTVELRLKELNC